MSPMEILIMLNPDEEMDSKDIYTPDLKPLTKEDMDEIAEMFAFLFDEEKAA